MDSQGNTLTAAVKVNYIPMSASMFKKMGAKTRTFLPWPTIEKAGYLEECQKLHNSNFALTYLCSWAHDIALEIHNVIFFLAFSMIFFYKVVKFPYILSSLSYNAKLILFKISRTWKCKGHWPNGHSPLGSQYEDNLQTVCASHKGKRDQFHLFSH